MNLEQALVIPKTKRTSFLTKQGYDGSSLVNKEAGTIKLCKDVVTLLKNNTENAKFNLVKDLDNNMAFVESADSNGTLIPESGVIKSSSWIDALSQGIDPAHTHFAFIGEKSYKANGKFVLEIVCLELAPDILSTLSERSESSRERMKEMLKKHGGSLRKATALVP